MNDAGNVATAILKSPKSPITEKCAFTLAAAEKLDSEKNTKEIFLTDDMGTVNAGENVQKRKSQNTELSLKNGGPA